ncbi:MAG: hypothetical protein D6699_00480 [Aquificota bacterium]|nr:MAG: hypothetical protein D6699_00480 [Aquificota bacterium]
MHHVLQAFHEITLRYTDLKWAKSRDDLISKSIKALRAFGEGKSLQEVLQNREISFEIEGDLQSLLEFVKSYPEDVERLIGLLSMFVKSPAPCKIKLINFVEALLEDRTIPEGKGL